MLEPRPVTLVLKRKVRAGREAEYEAWLSGFQQDSRKAPGYLGVATIRPAEGSVPREYVILVRFDSYQNLSEWERSEVWREWSARVPGDAIEGEVESQRLEGLEFWFEPQKSTVPVSPSRHKMAIVIVVVAVSLSLLLVPALSVLLPGLPTPIRTILAVVLQVILMTYVVMPRITKWLAAWLFSRYRHPRSR